MNEDVVHHYPPELTQLLIQTIPRLFRSKKDVLLFFKGAGVPDSDLSDLHQKIAVDRESITKFELARTVLTRVNDAGDSGLRTRREILKRVTEFDDFSVCWEGDRLAAEGLVVKVRQVVNVKDTFTRMKQEVEESHADKAREYRQRIEAQRARNDNLKRVREDLYSLFSVTDPKARGKRAEAVLNSLFSAYGVSVKDSFTLSDPDAGGIYEQIDGVIILDGEIYLVEMKWTSAPIGTDLVAPHLVRVFNRGACRGMFISAAGYTESAIHVVKQALQRTVFVLIGLDEIAGLLEQGGDLIEGLRLKVRAAISERDPQRRW